MCFRCDFNEWRSVQSQMYSRLGVRSRGGGQQQGRLAPPDSVLGLGNERKPASHNIPKYPHNPLLLATQQWD